MGGGDDCLLASAHSRPPEVCHPQGGGHCPVPKGPRALAWLCLTGGLPGPPRNVSTALYLCGEH